MARPPTSKTPEKLTFATPVGPRVTAERSGPSHEQIARRAYEIFIARGAQHGRHEDDWRQAERELTLGRQ